jgi:hypothetical protein
MPALHKALNSNPYPYKKQKRKRNKIVGISVSIKLLILLTLITEQMWSSKTPKELFLKIGPNKIFVQIIWKTKRYRISQGIFKSNKAERFTVAVPHFESLRISQGDIDLRGHRLLKTHNPKYWDRHYIW